MTDNEWMTVSEVSEKVNIPVETIRRYIRSHSVHLKVKKLGKKYSIHESSLAVIEQIRALYDRGKNIDEVEEVLSASGIPMTITVKNDNDESMTVNVADELQAIKRRFEQQEKFNEKLQQFNESLLEQLNQQQLYFEKKFEELKYDRELISSLREGMEQRKLESAENENKTDKQLEDINQQLSEIQQTIKEVAPTGQQKKGFFQRLFNK